MTERELMGVEVLKPERIYTRAELGAAMPDGWAISERQGWFQPFCGEIMALTPRRSLRAACDELAVFMVMRLATNVAQMGAMMLAQKDMFEDEVKGD